MQKIIYETYLQLLKEHCIKITEIEPKFVFQYFLWENKADARLTPKPKINIGQKMEKQYDNKCDIMLGMSMAA